tara:strand:- start:584 stop:1801 length:1218 start_codon:yes stop_codon:yes gene_type:complete
MEKLHKLLQASPKKIKFGLTRTIDLLESCGNPHKNLTSVQIIGTNGKGSTTSFIVNALKKYGYKTGMFTSPHLISVNERIRINDDLISNSAMHEFLNKYENDIKSLEPSFFEIITVMAIWYFNKKKVDIAILETGLGGRLDSITACNNKYLAFTSISMDHKEILGDTIEKIATEKAKAIISSNQYCISIPQQEIAEKILKQEAINVSAEINFINSHTIDLNPKYLLGIHQKENATLAYELLLILNKHKVINIDKQLLIENIESAQWPGRFQKIENEPTVIFDVCHNEDSLKMFYNNVRKYHKNNKNKFLICGFEYNKNVKKHLNQMEHLFNKIICTETGIRKSMPMETIGSCLNQKEKIIYIKDVNDAISFVKKIISSRDEIFIIGSHFFGPYIGKNFKNCFGIE